MAAILSVISVLGALLNSANGIPPGAEPVYQVAWWPALYGLEWGMSESDVATRLRCGGERERADQVCDGFRCMDQSSTFGTRQMITACFREGRLWKLQIKTVPRRRSGNSCDWFDAARSELSRAFGPVTCSTIVPLDTVIPGDAVAVAPAEAPPSPPQEKRLECTWDPRPGSPITLVRDDRVPSFCADTLIFFDRAETDRIQKLVREKGDDFSCGKKKSAFELHSEATRLDRDVQEFQNVLAGYRARSSALALAVKAMNHRTEYPAVRVADVLDLSGDSPDVATDPKFYETGLSKRIAHHERIRRCLGSVIDSRGLTLSDGCREAMCLPQFGLRGRCVYTLELLENGNRYETTYNVDALEIDQEDRAAGKELEVRACSIAGHFPGADRKPTTLERVVPALTYFSAEGPSNVRQLAPRCAAETKVMDEKVGAAVKEFSEDPWLRLLKRSVTSRLQLCQREAQKLCSRVYRVRDNWALGYVTQACKLRKVMESDISRDVQRWRDSGVSTDAELAEHESLKDLLTACRQFADAGITWKYQEPVPSDLPGCKAKGAGQKQKKAKVVHGI
jgi:hypothetical protein